MNQKYWWESKSWYWEICCNWRDKEKLFRNSIAAAENCESLMKKLIQAINKVLDSSLVKLRLLVNNAQCRRYSQAVFQ